MNSLAEDQKLNVGPILETEYYERQTSSGAPIQYLGIFISVIMAVGSSFAAMNTMYASVARRAKEIGTLRVLGFSRGSILISFFLESLLLALIGGRAWMPAGIAFEWIDHRHWQLPDVQ